MHNNPENTQLVGQRDGGPHRYYAHNIINSVTIIVPSCLGRTLAILLYRVLLCFVIVAFVIKLVLDLRLHTRETLVYDDCDIEPHLLPYPYISTAHPVRCPVGVCELAIDIISFY